MLKPIAIITARGGSKRIPKKNIKEFLGFPIIKYSIDAALESNIFSSVIVSTDFEEIAEVSLKYGAEVPFMRSEKNSDDYSTTADVIIEVLDQMKNANREAGLFCCIYPTAPFVTQKVLKESFATFTNANSDFCFPVCRFSYPPQRGLRIVDSRLEMLNEELRNTRSQDLEPVYHDAGQFYWGKASSIYHYKSLMRGSVTPFIIDDLQCQDIDHMTDWKIAELKYQLLKKENLI